MAPHEEPGHTVNEDVPAWLKLIKRVGKIHNSHLPRDWIGPAGEGNGTNERSSQGY